MTTKQIERLEEANRMEYADRTETLTVRVSPAMKEALEEAAESESREVENQAVWILKQALK